MPGKEDINRLYHMFEAACEATEYIKSRTRED